MLINFKDIEGQLARWLQVLGTHEFKIEHRLGDKHLNADALSRQPCQDCAFCERTEQNSRVLGKYDVVRKTRTGNQNWLIGIPSSQIARTQSEDHHIGKILKRFVNRNGKKYPWKVSRLKPCGPNGRDLNCVKAYCTENGRMSLENGLRNNSVPEMHRADIIKCILIKEEISSLLCSAK